MCFSANASFAAAGLLSVISLLSIRKVHTKKITLIALTPLFFGLQQASEGFVWLGLNKGDTTSMLYLTSMYLFLFFAAAFWPTWIPLSLYVAEESQKKRRLLQIFMYGGIVVSLLFLYCWVLQTTGAVATNHHIDYPVINYPFDIANGPHRKIADYLLGFFYSITTIVPFFISTIPYMNIVGTTIGIGALVAYIFYVATFPSVWCFFAAAGSLLMYFVICNYEKKEKKIELF